MARRSIRASQNGIIKAKHKFELTGWTQEYLAAEVGLLTRQSIWKFFTGRPIERHLFIEICFKLDLEWEEIADLPKPAILSPEKSNNQSKMGIGDLVSMIRSQISPSIQTQCRILQSSLELTGPRLLENIYTNVRILPNLSNQRWLEVSDLQNSSSGRVSLGDGLEDTIAGMEIVSQHNKLLIFGKPGAGKTTFLQRIAIDCDEGRYKEDCIPVFIQLRSFIAEAEKEEDLNFINYLYHLGGSYNLSSQEIDSILQKGKILLLLDGLDEISGKYSTIIIQQIDKFAQDYYQNQVIITCRSAGQQYYFRGFTYVEIADFNGSQIREFAQKWFMATASSEEEGKEKAQQFIEELDKKDNQPIRELVVTPILLSLICSVFQERWSFPSKRSKLYQAGLDILLIRWDKARGIQRDITYKKLSLADKITLLCEIAASNFEKGNYFFEKNDVLYIIENYIRNLPDTNLDPETLWLNAEAVLKAIQLQHGLLVERAKDIYSFSHLTFQEYLTARKIVANRDTQILESALGKLAQQITNLQWREVILLTSSMLQKADFLLVEMRKQLDNIVNNQAELQDFLVKIDKKVKSITTPYKIGAVRAFYYTLFQENRDLNLAVSLDGNLASNLANELALDLALARAFAASITLVEKPDIKQILSLGFALDFERSFRLDDKLKIALNELKQMLPDLSIGKENLQNWWQSNGEKWLNKFHSILIENRQIGYYWQLDHQQQKVWLEYYQANEFLIECLHSDSQVSAKIIEEIEASILTPLNHQEN